MKHHFFCLLLTIGLSFPTLAKPLDYDVYPNPRFLNDFSGLETRTLRELQQIPYKHMETIIKQECDAITDWYIPFAYETLLKVKNGELIQSDAQKQLYTAANNTAYQLSHSTAYPFGLTTYQSFDKWIAENIQNGVSKLNTVAELKRSCVIDLNPAKYKTLLNKNYDIQNVMNELNIQDTVKGSLLPLLSNTPPENSVMLSETEAGKMNITEQEFLVAKMLIANDIQIGLEKQGIQNWLIFKHIVDKKIDELKAYIKYGGENNHYLQILATVKMADLYFDFSSKPIPLSENMLERAMMNWNESNTNYANPTYKQDIDFILEKLKSKQ